MTDVLKAKMIVFRLGYNSYAVPRDKAQQLIDLLGEAPQVHNPDYDNNYWLTDKYESALREFTLGEVTMTTKPKDAE
jgi:hypothetical protein